MKSLHSISFILLVIGGLNWLLVGLFGWDISRFLGGSMTAVVPKIIYILVGLAAINEAIAHRSICKMCDKSMSSQPAAKPMM